MNDPDPQDVVQWEEAFRWLEKAAQDIRAAHILLDADGQPSAAMHVQQAVEKILKSLLVAVRQDVRKTHDLNALAGLVHPHWPLLVQKPFPLAYPSRWYLISRYPAEGDQPSIGEVQGALHEARTLFLNAIAEAPGILAPAAGCLSQLVANKSSSEEPPC